MNSHEPSVKSVFAQSPDAVRLHEVRRATLLFSQTQPADYIYFIEQGLVKLTRTNVNGEKIILAVRGPNDLAGEEILSLGENAFQCEAEVLTTVSALRMTREAIANAIAGSPALVAPLIGYLLTQKTQLARKVELLCLHDVEYRILYYLAELCKLIQPVEGTQEFQIPITQLELADLIGATRETTSTTLNQLERRGLLKLSRRMMTVPSPERLRSEPKLKAKTRETSGAESSHAELKALEAHR